MRSAEKCVMVDSLPDTDLDPLETQEWQDALSAVIEREGQINAWDSEAYRNAIKATGRKKIIMAGIVTDVCLLFPALSA